MKIMGIAALAAAVTGTAIAQIPASGIPLYFQPSIPARVEAMPRSLPRAKGPGLIYALQLAQAAVEACAAREEAVSVRVADSVGTTVVLLSGDGAEEWSQLSTEIAALETARYQQTLAELKERAQVEPRLAGNHNILAMRGATLLLTNASTLVGVLAVSGAPGLDRACAQEALDTYPLPS